MADRVVSDVDANVPELDENLEAVLVYAVTKARDTMAEGEEMVPFTALAVKDTLFMESHPAETAEECFNQARHTVQGAQGATCYALCYDGYVDADDGQKDAVIAEGGLPGEPEGYAVGLLYTEGEDGPVFEDEIVYIGTAPNFMMGLSVAGESEVDDDDRDEADDYDRDEADDYDRDDDVDDDNDDAADDDRNDNEEDDDYRD